MIFTDGLFVRFDLPYFSCQNETPPLPIAPRFILAWQPGPNPQDRQFEKTG
jgi:hypothetical protein